MPDYSKTDDQHRFAWERLVRFSMIFLIGWLVALVFHQVADAVFRTGHPYNSFLFRSDDRFNDLIHTWHQAMSPAPYTKGLTPAIATYFPFVYLLLSALRDWAPSTLLACYGTATFGTVSLIFWIWLRSIRPDWQGDRRWPAVMLMYLLICLMSYPLLFAYDRGNLDPIIMGLFTCSMLCLQCGRPNLSGAVLGVSAAFKGFTLVGLLPMIRRRQWTAMGIAVASLVLLIVLPGLAFDGGISGTLDGLQSGLAAFQKTYVHGGASSAYSADAYNGVRWLRAFFHADPPSVAFLLAYHCFTLLWAGALAMYAVFLASTPWRERLALALIMLVFPNVTNDYKLIFLLPVILDWLNAPDDGWRGRLFGWCAALLLIPKHYYFIPGTYASLSCLVSPVLLITATAVLWPNRDERTRLQTLVADLQHRFGRGRNGPEQRSGLAGS